jgi:myo-inositol 2-dehydrogenase/D-chiro-inositol 1-dehydrogenase
LTAAAQFNVPRFTSDAMDVITDPEVDAVWICSPSSFHAEQIKACAANGKHVFCEKPLATDLSATVEAINACNEAGVKLMTGLQRRFDSNFKRVKDAVVNKEVGETIMVSIWIWTSKFVSFRLDCVADLKAFWFSRLLDQIVLS